MQEALYKIRLYGYIGRDKRAFSEKLAAVLAIDKLAARDLLENVPTPVAEGLRESRAKGLHELLAQIGALCLVEPMEEGASLDSAASATGDAVSDRSVERPGGFPTFGPKLWILLVVGVTGAVLSFAASSILSSYLDLRSRNRSVVPSVEHQTAIIQPEPSSRSLPSVADALRGEIDAGERQAAHLKFLKDIREAEMRAGYGKYGVKPSVGREKMLQWEEARRDWEEEMENLRKLRAQLDALEKVARTE